MTIPTSLRDPSPSGRTGGWTRSRIVFLAISAAAFLGFLLWAREVLLPFILALILSYVLTPLVARCERRGLPRAASIILVYVTTLGTIYGFLAIVAPRIYLESARFAGDAPALARQLAEKWGPAAEQWLDGVASRPGENPPPHSDEDTKAALEITRRADGTYEVDVGSGIEIMQREPGRWRVGPTHSSARFQLTELLERGIDEGLNYLKRNAFELMLIGKSLVQKLARSIFLLFMTLMVAGYIMHTRENILGFFRSLLPPRSRPGLDRLLWRIDRGLAGVVRGQLLICLVNGVLSAIGFWLFGLKYWPILSILAAVMSLVPIFGSIMSSIPAVVIGLTQGFWIALWVLLWIIGIHQIEANLLNPKIIGVAAKIHPVLVVLALLVGEHFFGLWGALLAVPAWSITQSIFQHFRFESMPDAPPDSLVPPR